MMRKVLIAWCLGTQMFHRLQLPLWLPKASIVVLAGHTLLRDNPKDMGMGPDLGCLPELSCPNF